MVLSWQLPMVYMLETMQGYCDSLTRRCDFLQFFCTSIRTERTRKMFLIFLILNEISCGKVEKTLNLFAATEYLSVSMRAVFFYICSNKDFHTMLELVWKHTPYLKSTLI